MHFSKSSFTWIWSPGPHDETKSGTPSLLASGFGLYHSECATKPKLWAKTGRKKGLKEKFWMKEPRRKTCLVGWLTGVYSDLTLLNDLGSTHKRQGQTPQPVRQNSAILGRQKKQTQTLRWKTKVKSDFSTATTFRWQLLQESSFKTQQEENWM